GLRNSPMPHQRRLDLPRLDPEAAHLHLRIRATQKLQHPVRTPARQVPGAVHPASRSTMRVRNKPLRRQPRSAQIAARKPRARNENLPASPSRNWLKSTVQYINTRVPDRTANRHRSVIRIGGLQVIGRAAARRLSRTVMNNEFGLREMLAPGCKMRSAHAFAADDDAMSQT